MIRTIATAALGAATLFFATGSGEAQKAGPQDGKALYDQFGCYACHGRAGGGGASSGPPLAGRGFGANYIAAYVREPKAVMPPYRSSVLSDAQLAAISRYVVSLPGAKPYTQVPKLARLAPAPVPAAPAVAAAPAAARTSVASIYAANCAMCHGDAGQGGIAPALTGEAAKRTAEQTIALIRHPPAGMPQLTPDPIAAEDLPALADFVRGLAASAR